LLFPLARFKGTRIDAEHGPGRAIPDQTRNQCDGSRNIRCNSEVARHNMRSSKGDEKDSQNKADEPVDTTYVVCHEVFPPCEFSSVMNAQEETQIDGFCYSGRHLKQKAEVRFAQLAKLLISNQFGEAILPRTAVEGLTRNTQRSGAAAARGDRELLR
jgi:hypothetical protein